MEKIPTRINDWYIESEENGVLTIKVTMKDSSEKEKLFRLLDTFRGVFGSIPS